MRVADVRIVGFVEEEGQALVEVVLEDDDGHIERFVMDFWEMLDTEKFARILHNWKTNILPKRKKVHNLIKVKRDMQSINDFIAALRNLRVEATDAPDTVENKILQKVQKVLDRIEKE